MGILFFAIMVMGVVISDVFSPFKQYDSHQPFSIPFNVYCSLFVKLHSIGLCFVPKLPYSTLNNFFEPNHSNDESLSTIEYVFLFYFVLCLCGALFMWRFVPEKKQFSLIDVQRQLDIDYEHIYYIPAV
jgi:hypothetical protein